MMKIDEIRKKVNEWEGLGAGHGTLCSQTARYR